MRIYTSIDSFKDEVTIYKNGEIRNNDYNAKDVLNFIESQEEKLMEISKNGRTTQALELFQIIYPKIKFNEEILEKLFQIGGKAFFEEVIGNTTLMYDDKTKLKVYNVAIRGASRRIDKLEERICEEKINESDSSVIEELENQLIEEEEWKNDVKKQRQEMVSKITEKPEYNSNGFDVKTRYT